MSIFPHFFYARDRQELIDNHEYETDHSICSPYFRSLLAYCLRAFEKKSETKQPGSDSSHAGHDNQTTRAWTTPSRPRAEKKTPGATHPIPARPIGKGGPRRKVSRDTPGQTTLEKTIIRWAIDSDPQGARVFYRVLSSIPAVVKNTNETYLMTTPYEETRAFNILGLTYENSRDVQIEIKVVKSGYEAQVKRFNVRQAIDQQEISSFFILVPKEE